MLEFIPETREITMDDSLHSYIDAVLLVFDRLDQASMGISKFVKDDIEEDSKSVLKADALLFLLYLSAADGDISSKESYFIGEYLGVHISTEDMRKTIKDNNIYSIEFEGRVPLSVQFIVETDNMIVKNGKKDSSGCRMIYDFYKLLGQAFIACDNSVTNKEIQNLACYLETIKLFINNNASTTSKILSDTDADARKAVDLVEIYENKIEESSIISNKVKGNNFQEQIQDSAPWDVVYYKYPCPYCGKYKVRPAKWQDKQFSTAFWGYYSYKLHCNFKCDACKNMWN